MRVVVGVTGGIAAYKAALAIRELVQAGHDVHVVPTTAALRFIGKPTLEALSRNSVTDDLYDDVAAVRHVAIGQSADLIVILPATANTIAKLAAGIADDLLGTTVLASKAPLVIAPAMHTEMWEHPATQANIRTLTQRGVTIIGPVAGELTGGDAGLGRMAEPADIVASALEVAGGAVRQARALADIRVVISAGGTREPIDPVRFIANRSSGAMGVAIAVAARDAGATVTLVAANLQVKAPAGVTLVEVETAEQLRAAILQEARADVVIMAAAVADFRAANVASEKRSKEEWGDEPSLRLVRNPDVLVELSAAASGLVVGFAAETEPDDEKLLARGQAKLASKGADLLVVNRVGDSQGFGDVETTVSVIDASGVITTASGPKMSVAREIISVIEQRVAATKSTNEGA